MSADQVLAGGVAVVTGAGSGIGEGIAREASRRGMKVVLADIATDRIEAIAAELRAGGQEALAVTTNVADHAAIERLAATTHETFGDVRLLVNNAGIEMLGHIWEIPAELWNRALGVNVLGVIHGVRAFAPRMLAAGREAFIANVASVGALGIMPTQTPYIVSKHAVLSFTECLALEMEIANAPISVSAVLPGPVATRIFRDAPVGNNPQTVDQQRAFMNAMLENHGLSAAEAACKILDGVVAKQFWVSTHPEMMADLARGRAQHLTDLDRPRLNTETRSILAAGAN